MENKNNSNEEDKKALDINNIELFLIKSGYLSQKLWTKENSDWFDWNKANEILLGFEFNENISPTEASVKYGDKFQWINKSFKNGTTIEEFHRLYNHYTSTNISFLKLINNLIMLELILKKFNNIINSNSEQDFTKLFTQQIIVNDIDINYSLHDKNIGGLKQKLESIYTKINKNPSFNGKEANPLLIIIIFLLSMGSSFSVDQNIPQITNLMNLFTLYNIIYVNDINLSLILFLNVIICINLCICANKKKSYFKCLSFDNTNYSSYYYQDSKKKNNSEKNANNEQNDDKKKYISLFIIDNDIITYNGDYFLELIKFQNCLKIFSIYFLNKNQIKMTINLTINTIIEILTFFDNISINVNTYNIQNTINTNNNNNTINNMIKLNNLSLLCKNNISKCFSMFNFNELIISVTNFKEENQIKEINTKYLELIQKTKKLYFQNSITILNHINKRNIDNNNNKNDNQVDNQNKNDDNTSMDMLIIEFKALNYLLNYFHKNKDAKKKLQFYCFKFRYFKCSIFREGQKEIQIYFDYSSIKERILQKYLKDITNILSLIKQYEAIIDALYDFKLYNIVFRVCQTNFGSSFINFYFTIIIKKLVFFIKENKYNRITIYDSKLKTYEQNMLVYIKDEDIKQKTRINSLKEMFNESFFNNKLKVFNTYVKELVDDWDIIIIGEDIKYNNIIYSEDVNILFLNIVKEINDNSVQNFMAGSSIIKMSMNIGMSVNPVGQGDDKVNQATNNLVNYEYLNILMYITNDEDFADKILKFSEDLKNNTNCVLNSKITLICERYFFEEKIIMNSRIKEGKQIYNFIDNYYLVCDTKKKEETLKYDLYITKKSIALSNHLNNEITSNCSQLIYSFISTLSSCVELILYIFKNKEVDPPAKFYYIQKIKKYYYLFEYKMSNIFVKKLKSYDSLLLLNAKKSIPLFCLLVDKENSEFSNENFLDLFLRLFLNLNKVIEPNKLNETFFEKIHKNMFFQNYDIFKLMVFSYDTFINFNDLFINNNYLQISKDDKFEICFIVPYDVESEQKKANFLKILDYENNNKLMVKNINIYDYNLTNSFIFQNTNELKMNYQKVEFFINYYKNLNDIQNTIKNNLMCVYKKIKEKKIEKKNIKKIMKNIKELYFEKNCISLYNSNTSFFEKLLIEFNTNQIKIKAVKLDHRAFHI